MLYDNKVQQWLEYSAYWQKIVVHLDVADARQQFRSIHRNKLGKKFIYTGSDEQLFILKKGRRRARKKYTCYHEGCTVYVILANGTLSAASGPHRHPSQRSLVLRLMFGANAEARCADCADTTETFESGKHELVIHFISYDHDNGCDDFPCVEYSQRPNGRSIV